MYLSQLARLKNNEGLAMSIRKWVRIHATEHCTKINVLGNFLINIIHGEKRATSKVEITSDFSFTS